MRIVIYALGAKGFSVIRELANFKDDRAKLTCVIGNDDNVANVSVWSVLLLIH